MVGRQGPVVTQFEAFLAVFGAKPTLAGSRLAGRPRAGREKLTGLRGRTVLDSLGADGLSRRGAAAAAFCYKVLHVLILLELCMLLSRWPPWARSLHAVADDATLHVLWT